MLKNEITGSKMSAILIIASVFCKLTILQNYLNEIP